MKRQRSAQFRMFNMVAWKMEKNYDGWMQKKKLSGWKIKYDMRTAAQ